MPPAVKTKTTNLGGEEGANERGRRSLKHTSRGDSRSRSRAAAETSARVSKSPGRSAAPAASRRMLVGPPTRPPRAGDNVQPPIPGREPLPSRFDPLLASPLHWMKEKVEDDAARQGIPSNLWAVHGHLYDLTEFMHKHPGGPEWLSLTKGSDVTDAFEVHHLAIDRARRVLEKYRVGTCPVPQDAQFPDGIRRFTYAPGGFFHTLRDRVRQELGGNHGPTVAMKFTFLSAYVMWSLAFYVMATSASTRTLSIATVVAGIALHGLLGVGHSTFHQKPSWWQYAFDFSLFSSHEWLISHALSHHLYPNLDLDLEVSAVEPFLFFMSSSPHNYPIIVYPIYGFICCSASLLDFSRRLISFLLGRHRLRPENLIVVLELAALVYMQGAWVGTTLFLGMQMIASFLLLVTSFPVHRTEKVWTAGDKNPHEDYGEHIIATTSDHSPNSPLPVSLYAFALLNAHHTLHHLFPTVDHSRLSSLRGTFHKTLKEFNVPYRTYSFVDLLVSSFRRHDMHLL